MEFFDLNVVKIRVGIYANFNKQKKFSFIFLVSG
jgi:hypothetical protein